MASESVYVACDEEEILQGDIVADLPWGAIEAPLIVCRPDNARVRKGRAHFDEASGFDRAFKRKREAGKEFVHAKAGRGPGIVLWHSCEIADDVRHGNVQRAVVGVAPIFSMAERLNEADRGAVRELRRTAMFPLPQLEVDGERLDEGYVDFRWIWSVKRSLLVRRLAGLSDRYLESMYRHLEMFLTRRRVSTTPGGASVEAS